MYCNDVTRKGTSGVYKDFLVCTFIIFPTKLYEFWSTCIFCQVYANSMFEGTTIQNHHYNTRFLQNIWLQQSDCLCSVQYTATGQLNNAQWANCWLAVRDKLASGREKRDQELFSCDFSKTSQKPKYNFCLATATASEAGDCSVARCISIQGSERWPRWDRRRAVSRLFALLHSFRTWRWRSPELWTVFSWSAKLTILVRTCKSIKTNYIWDRDNKP